MRLVLNSVDVGNNESTLQAQTIDIYKKERKKEKAKLDIKAQTTCCFLE